jgi:hypothetical protein
LTSRAPSERVAGPAAPPGPRAGRERRRFSRVAFDAAVQLETAEGAFAARLEDISLEGALVTRPEGWRAPVGSTVRALVRFEGADASLAMEARVAHVSERGVGLERVGLDLEGAAHLRRLLLHHVDDPAALDRELATLLGPA